MLEFNKEFLKEINACKWLKNCGNYEDLAFDFPVQIAKNKKMQSRVYVHWIGKIPVWKDEEILQFSCI